MNEDALVLSFDTSAGRCDVALTRGSQTLGSFSEAMARGQAERLLGLCTEVVESAEVKLEDLSAIGVGVGPGNFTGIRISVAAARGLALGLGIPAVGVSSLEALAFGTDGACRTVVNARRGHVIAQDFVNRVAVSTPTELTHEALEAEGVAYIGPGGQPSEHPVPVAIARIACGRFADNPPRPSPLYLRPADAAPPKDAGPVILS